MIKFDSQTHKLSEKKKNFQQKPRQIHEFDHKNGFIFFFFPPKSTI